MYVTELQQLKEMEQAPGRSMPSEGCWQLNNKEENQPATSLACPINQTAIKEPLNPTVIGRTQN